MKMSIVMLKNDKIFNVKWIFPLSIVEESVGVRVRIYMWISGYFLEDLELNISDAAEPLLLVKLTEGTMVSTCHDKLQSDLNPLCLLLRWAP